MPPKLIGLFQQFKADLAGWDEVSLADFRELERLRGVAKWAAADSDLVARHAANTRYALTRLYVGTPAEAAAKAALASAGGFAYAPEPLSRAELDNHLSVLLKNCATGGWAAADYHAFLDRLAAGAEGRDDAALETLTSQLDQATDRIASAKRTRSRAAVVKTAASAQSVALRVEKAVGGGTDLFGEYYRAAGGAYRGHIRQRLLDAAGKASGDSAVKAVGKPAVEAADDAAAKASGKSASARRRKNKKTAAAAPTPAAPTPVAPTPVAPAPPAAAVAPAPTAAAAGDTSTAAEFLDKMLERYG